MNIDLGAINWLAVLVAAFATFMLGGLWYTVLFGKLWQRLNGYTTEKLAEMGKRRPPPVFFGTLLVCYLAVSILMAMVISAFGIDHWLTGAAVGLFVFGIAAAVQATGQLASDKPMRAMLIDLAYQAIYLPMTGAILAAW